MPFALVCAHAAFAADSVRIGVLGLFRPREMVVKPLEVVVVEAGGETVEARPGQSVGLRVESGGVDCFVARRTIAGERVRIGARGGGPARLRLGVRGKIERTYHGALEVRAWLDTLEAVLAIDRESAVASAVAAESPPGAPLEALKAQAVVTRSYYAASRARHERYDFCDTTHCQFLRAPPGGESPPARAAEETRGLLLVFENRAVAALFSASCGGRTRTLLEVGLPADGYPYFAVDCAECRQYAKSWTTRLTGEDAQRVLASPNREALRLDLGRHLGWSRVPGNHYTVERDGSAAVLHGRGAGHGVGLCQMGAAGMARRGARFRAILEQYFPNVSFWVSGH